MQDYAKLYKAKHEKLDPHEVVYKVRQIIRSGIKPATMVLLIGILVESSTTK